MSTLGERILDACLRRVRTSEWASVDLVLVRAHNALGELPAMGDLIGEQWRIESVSGELTLRDALPETGKLLAVVPAGFVPPPDIAGRAWLNKPIDIRADDIVSGVTNRPCEPLPDEDLSRAVIESVDLLAAQVGRWSQHGPVSAAEVRAVLVAADLGTDERLDRERDHHLLTRWILHGAPRSRVPVLLARSLEEAIPRTGRWLSWVARTGDVPALLAAGAVGADADGSWSLEPPPRTNAERQELRALVDRAVRDAWRVDAQKTAAGLQTAERLAHRVRAVEEDPGRYSLVRAALDRALFRFARLAADGKPADDATVDSLRANLYAPSAAEVIEHVQDLGRIARALALPVPSGGVEGWAAFGSSAVGWLDLAMRGVRRRLEIVPADIRVPSERLLRAAVGRRDEWNRTFATSLSADWAKVAATKDLRRALPLHQVTRSLVSRLVDDGGRVLLVVLDGCDLSTFLELANTLPDGVGLALPPVTDGALRDDLAAVGAFRVAISPIPTVTNHARRALFAGEIPGNTALDDTESPSANATADATAFGRNQALKDAPRLLLLKGQLSDGALDEAIARPDLRVLAVVWNGVDDALSSKETTALGPWNIGALGVRAAASLKLAVDAGWTVVVTADHGHTPFWDASRKVAPGALGARYHSDALAGAVQFTTGPLPSAPLHLLTDIGAWAGTQRRGFHGGAGLEEVLVPLALLGRSNGRPRPPAWWWSGDGVEVPLAEAPAPAASEAPTVASAAPGGRALAADVRDALASQPAWVAAVERIAEREILSLAQLSSLVGRPPFLVGGMMSSILATLARAGVTAPFVEEAAGPERIYRWRRT